MYVHCYVRVCSATWRTQPLLAVAAPWFVWYTYIYKFIYWYTHMGWLRWIGSVKLKLQVSFAKEPYKRDDILQRRHVILSIIMTLATPYAWCMSAGAAPCFVIYMYLHFIYLCIHKHSYAYYICMFIYIHTYIHSHVRVWTMMCHTQPLLGVAASWFRWYIYIYILIHAGTYTYIYVCMYMHIYIHIHVHVWTTMCCDQPLLAVAVSWFR